MHGELSLVQALLVAVKFDPKIDRLICTGDLVDRGPSTIELLRFLNQAAKSTPRWFFSVAGNHDRCAINAARGDDASVDAHLTYMSGGWIGELQSDGEELIDFLDGLPLCLEVETPRGLVGVVHGGVPQGLAWSDVASLLPTVSDGLDVGRETGLARFSKFDAGHVLWNRTCAKAFRKLESAHPGQVDDFTAREWLTHATHVPHGINWLVSGHSTMRSPGQRLGIGRRLHLDTGCGYAGDRVIPGGQLTAWEPAANLVTSVGHFQAPATRPLPVVDEARWRYACSDYSSQRNEEHTHTAESLSWD